MDADVRRMLTMLSQRVDALAQALAAMSQEIRSRAVTISEGARSPVERKLNQLAMNPLDTYAMSALRGLLARHESRENDVGAQSVDPCWGVENKEARSSVVTMAMRLAIECLNQRQSLTTDCVGREAHAAFKCEDLPPELRSAAEALHDALDLEWEGE